MIEIGPRPATSRGALRWALAATCLFINEPSGPEASTSSARPRSATFQLYRSVDAGRSWTRAGRALPPSLRIDALGQAGSTRLAGTERGLFVSTDDGRSWRRPERGVPDEVKVYAFASSDGAVYGATARGVYRAGVDGLRWDEAGGLGALKVLSITASRGEVFAGTDGHGVFLRREEEGDFVPLGSGLPAGAQVFELVLHRETLFAGLYARGIYRFDRASHRWVSAGEEWPLRLVSSGDAPLSGRNPGGVFTTRDAGGHWRESSLGLPPRAPVWMMAAARGSVFLGTAGSVGLYRSDDDGALWRPSDQGLPPGADAITFDASDASLLVVVLSDVEDGG